MEFAWVGGCDDVITKNLTNLPKSYWYKLLRKVIDETACERLDRCLFKFINFKWKQNMLISSWVVYAYGQRVLRKTFKSRSAVYERPWNRNIFLRLKAKLDC